MSSAVQIPNYVDEVTQACGIPIFHFPARRAYSAEDLRKSLFAEG